jgi:GntR family transcriptional regulator
MAVEYNAVPLKYAPDLCQYDFKVFSLHNVYAKNNIRIVSEHQTLEIVKASNPQARLLNLEEGDGVFLLTSYAVDDRNRIVEYTRIYNSDDRIVFYASADEAGKL